MSSAREPLTRDSAGVAPAPPFGFAAWSRDPSAAVPSRLTGRKLLFIVLGLTAGWVVLVTGATAATALLLVKLAHALLAPA